MTNCPTDTIIEDYDDDWLHDHEFSDCTLSQSEVEAFLAPSAEKWHDYFATEHPAVITMDSAKTYQWNLAKQEMNHLRKNICNFLGCMEPDKVTEEDLLLYFLGPESKSGQFLIDELEISEHEYMQFMGTLCIQSAYRISTEELFGKTSFLRDQTLMNKSDYIRIWKKLAEKRKLKPQQMSSS